MKKFAMLAVALLLVVLGNSFIRARSVKVYTPCRNHLIQIEEVKGYWASDYKKQTNDIPTWEDVRPYFKNSNIPSCPSGGSYTLGDLNTPARCSIKSRDHRL